jgi:hypothetical protein
MAGVLESMYRMMYLSFKEWLEIEFDDFYFLYLFIGLLVLIDFLAISTTLLAICFYKVHMHVENKWLKRDATTQISEQFL